MGVFPAERARSRGRGAFGAVRLRRKERLPARRSPLRGLRGGCAALVFPLRGNGQCSS